MKMHHSLTVAMVTASLALPNRGESEENLDGIAQLDPVIVTGSNLQRRERTRSPAVVVLDREKIERSGAQTLNGLLSRLPENTLGTNENVGTGLSFSPGTAGASLRGLGVSSTLVLLNGRRVAPFAFAEGGTDTFVDLNSIPLSAVERIEVLREGASAIYGSDAIAGVINVILKDSYRGFETETYYGNTHRSDAGEFRQSFSAGLDSGPLHIFLTGHYYHRNPLASVDRGFSASADHRRQGGLDFRSDFANPGTIFTANDILAVPLGSDGRLAANDFLPGELADGSLRNRYDANRDSELIAETERWGGLLTFRYDIAPHVEFFGELSYQAVQSKTRVGPARVDSDGDGLVVPATNPFNPFGEDVGFLWRSVETGLRRNTIELDAYRYLAGIRVRELPQNWEAEMTFLYSESNAVDQTTAGYLSVPRLREALNDPDPDTALNVFGDGKGINDDETLKRLVIQPRTDGLSYLYSFDLKARGELFDLPAGPVRLAWGGEYREEFHRQRFSVPAGSVASYGSIDSEGSRDVRSLYFETSIPIAGPGFDLPLVRALELTIAERIDDYSDFGQTAKPRFTLEWKPCAGLMMRGAYSEGFRAPSLPQLFSGSLFAFDSVTNPSTGQDDQVSVVIGGNPRLQPELSYSYFVGGTVEPPFIKGLRISLDYFHIEQRNLIGVPRAQDVVDDNAPGDVTTGSGGRITRVETPYANFGTTIIEGWDADLDYHIETSWGRVTLASSLAYISSFYQALEPNGRLSDRRDAFGFPEFKMTGSLFFQRGGLEAGFTVNYADSYDDERANNRGRPRTVGSWTTVDLQCSYTWPAVGADSSSSVSRRWRWLDDARLTIGCLNVGDCDPPFLNGLEGYDPQNADASGRFFYASLRKKFW